MLKNRHWSIKRGFTLIELLVVVAIIAVLMAILLPALSNARTNALAAKCGANERAIGQAIIGFSNENDGRMPGGAMRTAGGQLSWFGVLNAEYFNKGESSSDSQTMIQPMYGSGGTSFKAGTFTKTLYCPLFPPATQTNLRRCYMYNLDANGTNTSWLTSYGLALSVEQAALRSSYYGNYGSFKTPTATNLGYWLGAKYSAFAPSKILMIESNRASDVFTPKTPSGANGYLFPDNPPAAVGSYGTNGTNTDDSSGSVGAFMFRHNNQGTLASFLFFDGSVQPVRPTDEYNTARKLQLNIGKD